MPFEKKQKNPLSPFKEQTGTGFEPKKVEKVPDAKKALEEIDSTLRSTQKKKKKEIFDSCSCFDSDNDGDGWDPFG